MDGTGNLFDPLLERLSPSLNRVVVRYPSESVLGYAELGEVARQALPVRGNVILLAESFSGPIAISIARELGPRLRGLILCCSFAANPRPALNMLRPLLSRLPVRDFPSALVSFFLLGRFGTPELAKLLSRSIGSVSRKAFHARIRAVMGVDVRNTLHNIQVPVLYLCAGEDRLVPASVAADIARALPQLQLRVIEGPHCLLQTRPNECAREIQGFVERCNALD